MVVERYGCAGFTISKPIIFIFPLAVAKECLEMFMNIVDLTIPACFGFFLCKFFENKKKRFLAISVCILLANLFIQHYPEFVIDVFPKEAQIFIDGNPIGTGRINHRTSYGSHRIRLCLQNDPFFNESSEIIQTNYFQKKAIEKRLLQKSGRIYVDINKLTHSKDIELKVESVTIIGDHHWEVLDKAPFLFRNVPAGIYIVHIDYLKNGKKNRETIEQVYVIDKKLAGKVKINL
jgi:hypothetical protein